MGGGGGGSSTTYQKAETPDVYAPEAPVRTTVEDPTINLQPLFTEGVSRSNTELKKKTSPTSRLVIPLDTSNSATTGGTTPPPTPTGVV